MIPTRREIERELVDIAQRDGIAIVDNKHGDKIIDTEHPEHAGSELNLTLLATELHRWLKDRES